jgi:adenylate kinase
MDIFDNIIPVSSPSNTQVMGAFGVLQGHIIAQRAADMAAQVAVQATLSVLTNATENVQAADPEAAKKTKGGLYVV